MLIKIWIAMPVIMQTSICGIVAMNLLDLPSVRKSTKNSCWCGDYRP